MLVRRCFAIIPALLVGMVALVMGALPANAIGGVSQPNIVNLTYGINFEFSRRSILTFGLVTPVTSPKPFDYEALLLFNLFYGRTRRTLQGNAPMLGG